MGTNNSNIDLIKGDPKKAIIKLGWPMMVSMFLITSYVLVDSIWIVGLGYNALAALGFIYPLFMVFMGLGSGIGAGANSLIARSIGASDKKTADNAALHAVVITIIISILVPILLLPFLKDILIFMGAGDAVGPSLEYGYIVFGLVFTILFSSVGSAILRSEGDAKRSMNVIAITAIINIIIDPIFIYTLDMGMTGAAIATVLSSLVSCIIIVYWIWVKKNTFLSLNLKSFKFNNFILKDILKVAIPASSENLILSFLGLVLNLMFVIVGGTIAVAVYTAGMRILILFMIPMIGLGVALLTVSGAAYGAHDYKKLEISFNYTIFLGLVISSILSIIMFALAPEIAIIFTYTSSSADLTIQITEALRFLSFFLLVLPLGIAPAMVFQGVGRGFTSLIITIFRSLIFEAIFAYIFGILFGWGVIGLYVGVIVGCGLGCVIGFIWAKLFIKSYKEDLIRKYGNVRK